MKLSAVTNISSELARHSEFQPEPENLLGYNNSPRHHTTNVQLLSGRAFVVLMAISFAIAAIALLH